MNGLAAIGALAIAITTGILAFGGAEADAQASLRQGRPPPRENPSGFDIERYFREMEQSVSVYDPASPWLYDGKEAWRRRVDQMMKIRQFLDLNAFERSEVELGDMRVVTVYRELRRVEGSLTSRLHGRITWVYLRAPDGTWNLWHDHTAEIPRDYSYRE
jgi:ketosteroid isomerase-like protein